MRAKFLVGAVAAVFLMTWAGSSASTSPVADAASKRDLATVKALLAQKADVNAQQADGATALQWAAYHNDVAMADVLIAAGAKPTIANREGATPMYLASIEGNAAMIERLLKAGADVNELGPEGETPLMLASRNGTLDAVKVLLAHKADVNAKDKARGNTALMFAAEQGHADAMKLLVAAGASVSATADPDAGGKPRNNLAPSVTQRLNSAFGVNGQRARGGRPTTPGAAGVTPEDFAGGNANEAEATPAPAAGGQAAAGQGAPGQGGRGGRGGNRGARGGNGQGGGGGFGGFFNRQAVKDGGGLTALVLAARQDCLECAKVLLDAGADVNEQTNYGWTALLTATQNRHYKLGAYLMDKGANPNIPNKGGWTALYLATDNRNIEGGDYPVRTPDMDHLDYIKLLIDKGANVNARICGSTSTPEQCTGDTTETRTNFTMQWLFEDGATPFLRAAQSGDVTLMKLLLAHGANPKIFTAHNVTPLAVAAGIGWVEGVTFEWSPEENIEAVKMCLDLGIDPNVADDEGRTSLHGAAHKGRPEVIQLLVDHGANLLAQDMGSRDSVNGGMLGQKWIPLDWARGLVRVGVQSAIPHPDAEKLIVKLMEQKGMKVPPPPNSSRCLTVGVKGCA